ncbi:MAG: lysophospholipid acyltransferase family protein [Marinilabiliaceae bacterium]|nr:lysophospholipid acyltransferase family protein [Marinilabiliaceae bacterium]
MQALGFYLTYSILWLLSVLPLKLLYFIADILYVFIRIGRYRKKVITDNLKYSFPHLSDKEIDQIRNDFYRHFSDLILEIIKIQNMSEKEMRKRVIFKNLDQIHKHYSQDKDVIAILGHYGNWEWITSFSLHIEALACDVYHRLKNPHFDHHMLILRSKWGNANFEMKSSVREIVKLRQKNQRFVLGLIADQSPSKAKIQYCRPFLNQNTPVILGPEKMAKLTDSPVVFFHMDKIKRGHYEVNIIPISETAKNTAQYEITDKHIDTLERIIKERPELWLWSHKRWKYAENRHFEHIN